MTLEDLFLVDGNLRPVWRFFLSVVLVILAYVAAYLLAGEVRDLMPRAGAWYGSFFLFQLLAFLGSFKIMTRVFEQKPLGVVGLAFHPYWVKELCVGLGIGGIMIVSVGGAEALLALARYARNPLPARVELAYGSGMFLVLLISATNEELVFRGYPFQKLVESLGPPGAVAVSSACFGLAHLGNSHHTWISTVNTMLVGVPLSIAYLRTRSLWMPVGIHFAWNYVQGFVFGLPVSGFTFPTTLLNAQSSRRRMVDRFCLRSRGGASLHHRGTGRGDIPFFVPTHQNEWENERVGLRPLSVCCRQRGSSHFAETRPWGGGTDLDARPALLDNG